MKEDRERDDDEVTVSSRPAPSINRGALPRRSMTQSSRLSTQSHPYCQPSVGDSMGGLGHLPEGPGDLDYMNTAYEIAKFLNVSGPLSVHKFCKSRTDQQSG